MIFSTTRTRMLANFFANAFACGTGKRALLAAHHSIPVVHFFAILPSLGACFNWAMLLHVTARNTWADVGRFFRKRLRVWHRRARALCHSLSNPRGPILCVLAKLGRLLQIWAMLVHVAARWAVRALARRSRCRPRRRCRHCRRSRRRRRPRRSSRRRRRSRTRARSTPPHAGAAGAAARAAAKTPPERATAAPPLSATLCLPTLALYRRV